MDVDKRPTGPQQHLLTGRVGRGGRKQGSAGRGECRVGLPADVPTANSVPEEVGDEKEAEVSLTSRSQQEQQ